MNVRWRSRFKKDYQLMLKQGKDINALDYVIEELSAPKQLSESHLDHPLKGDYHGYRACHVEPNWLLIYGYEILDDGERQLLLVRTGSHPDLYD